VSPRLLTVICAKYYDADLHWHEILAADASNIGPCGWPLPHYARGLMVGPVGAHPTAQPPQACRCRVVLLMLKIGPWVPWSSASSN